MTFPKHGLISLLVLLASVTPCVGAQASTGDTVTMRNGDIYVGRLLADTLSLGTGMGELEIPVEQIHSITIDPGTQRAHIYTHAGEQLKGQLTDEAIRVSRLQDPTLPLSVGDIDNILLSRPEQPEQPEQPTIPSVWLETTAGDRLRVEPRFEQLGLQSADGERQYALARLRHIDTSLHSFEDELLTQFTLVDGTPIQGSLMTTSLPLSSPYRTELDLPVVTLSRLSLMTEDTAASGDLLRHSLRALGEGPQMVRLPGGSYLRGDYQGDGDDDEQPLSAIRLKPFAIGRFEVSFDEYDLFCRQTPACRLPDDQGWGRGQRPVINVSWLEAQAYADWLAARTGQPYRLPSDAEWEYAHRAGSTTRYTWGDEVGQAQANCEGCGSIWDGDKTAPRGRFEANAFGLHDTAGNVFEWVADCFTDRFADAPADGSAADKPGCGKRVIRGGAWSFPPHEIRSANRWRDFPSRRSDDTGFRLALGLE